MSASECFHAAPSEQTSPGRFRLLAVAFGAAVAFAGPNVASAQSGADTPKAVASHQLDLDIAPGPLADTLRQIARASGQSIQFESGTVQGRTSPAVHGRMNARRAVEIALSTNPSVSVEADKNGSLVIVEVLQKVEVKGKRYSHLADVNRTGTRVDTNPMALPQSVTTVSSETLQQQQIRDVRDAMANIAGASTVVRDGGTPAMTMRGFDAGIMRNGDVVGSGATFNPPAVAIDRIEVVKGPEAIVSGTNSNFSFGGIVNVITKVPEAKPVRDALVTLGSDNLREVGVDVGAPLDADKTVLARLILSTSKTGKDAAGYDGNNRDYVAPSLTWLNRSSGTEVSASYEWQDSRTKPPLTVIFDPNRPFNKDARPRMVGRPSDGQQDRHGVASVSISQRVVEDWDVSAHVSEDDSKKRSMDTFFLDNIGLVFYPEMFFFSYRNTASERTTTAKLSLNGSFETGPIKHSLLLAYDWMSSSLEYAGQRMAMSVSNVVTGQGRDVSNDPQFTDIFGPVETDPYSFSIRPKETGLLVYDNLTWGDWVLLAGWRQLGFEQGDSTVPNQRPFHEGIPSLGVVYRVDPTLSFYGSASKGFNPNLGFRHFDGSPLKPSRAQQAELGFKALFQERAVAVTGSIFKIRQQDVAVEDLAHPPVSEVWYVTIPGATATGFEIDVSGQLTSNLELRANYGYLDKHATSPDGLGLLYTRHQGNVWAAYRFDDEGGWWLGGGLRVNSGVRGWNDPTAIPVGRQMRVDLSGGYDADRWAVTLGVKNATDRRLYDINSRGDRSAILTQPREYFATAQYSF